MLYEIISPLDGQTVGYRLIVDKEEADNPSMVFENIEEGMIWDAVQGIPRHKTEEELLPEVQNKKKSEMKRQVIRKAIYYSGDPDVKSLDDLLLLVLPAMFNRFSGTAMANAAHLPPTNLDSMMADFAKYYEKKSQIEATTHSAEVNNITWDETSSTVGVEQPTKRARKK